MEGKRGSVLGLLAFLASLPFVVPLCNKNRPVIFNFGDSNSDTGGLSAGLGTRLGYPYRRTFFKRPTGRATDGRLVIDFLSEYLGSNYLNPYLDALQPNFTNGANFAIVGAATQVGFVPFNLSIEILQFKRFHCRSLDLNSQ
ncbi:UNVERIFIED_CONTAM: GDSL esterase/lipase, partial [Sesamum radiatum]